MNSSKTKTQWSGYWFTLPAALMLGALVVYPLLYGFYISLFDTNLLFRWNFIGLRYYLEVFTNAEFLGKILLTLKFTFFTVAGHFIVGMILALILNQKFPGRVFFRAVLIVPWLFPEVVVGLLWKWMLNPMYGLFNQFLQDLGLIAGPVSWLGNQDTAFISVVIAAIWKGFPLVMILLLAGLQAIPDELYEAGQIDGASRQQIFRFITLPSLRSVLMVTLILDTVWWFKHFTIIWILTQGGPVNATSVVSIDIFKTAFEYFRFGQAAALAVVVFFVCFLIGYVYRRKLGEDDD
jgi:multiple sugar transport system permease protein